MSVKAQNPVTMRARRQREGEHGAWFRAEVEQALREADDPATRRVANEDVKMDWRRRRAELEEWCSGLPEEKEEGTRG